MPYQLITSELLLEILKTLSGEGCGGARHGDPLQHHKRKKYKNTKTQNSVENKPELKSYLSYFLVFVLN